MRFLDINSIEQCGVCMPELCAAKKDTYPAFKTQRSWKSRFGSKLANIEQQHPLCLNFITFKFHTVL